MGSVLFPEGTLHLNNRLRSCGCGMFSMSILIHVAIHVHVHVCVMELEAAGSIDYLWIVHVY